MAEEPYSINIKLDVDDKELDAAIKKAQGLQNGVAGTAAAGAGAAGARINPNLAAAARRHRRQGLTIGQRDWVVGAAAWSRRMPWLLDARPMRRGLASINRAVNMLNYDFSRNLFSIGGFRRNLGNFTNVLTQTAGALINAVPALKGLTSGLVTLGGIKALGAAAGGIAMFGGGRVLMGSSVGEAASNIMQFNAARMGLGASYDDVYRRGSEIAATYGYSRAGVIQAANVMSGLHVNGRPMGVYAALRMAGIAGKLAQSGGVDYNRVSLNLQQMLGQPTVNMRDIRELIGQSPLIAKIAQQRMIADTGRVGDIRSFLQDKANLLDVLYEFDRQISAHPVMALRGRVTLSRENLWMKIADVGVPFFKDVSGAMERFNSMIGSKIEGFMSSYDTETMRGRMDAFTGSVSSIIDIVSGGIGVVGDLLKAVDGHVGGLTGAAAGWKIGKRIGGLPGGVIGSAIGFLGGGFFDSAKKDEQRAFDAFYSPGRDIVRKGLREHFVGRWEPGMGGFKSAFDYADAQIAAIPQNEIDSYVRMLPRRLEMVAYGKGVKARKETVFGQDNEARYRNNPENYKQDASGNWKYYNALPRAVPYGSFGRDTWDSIVNKWDNVSAPDVTGVNGGNVTTPNDRTESMIKASIGERRSLTINFNREIVNMPTNITATGVDNLEGQLRGLMEDVVTSGLMRALSFATNR